MMWYPLNHELGHSFRVIPRSSCFRVGELSRSIEGVLVRIPTRRTAGPLVHKITLVLWILSLAILAVGLIVP